MTASVIGRSTVCHTGAFRREIRSGSESTGAFSAVPPRPVSESAPVIQVFIRKTPVLTGRTRWPRSRQSQSEEVLLSHMDRSLFSTQTREARESCSPLWVHSDLWCPTERHAAPNEHVPVGPADLQWCLRRHLKIFNPPRPYFAGGSTFDSRSSYILEPTISSDF